MFKMDVNTYVEYLESAIELINKNKEYVTQLDAETGDGDHWANMSLGFGKLIEKKDTLVTLSLPGLFRECGMTLMSAAGGSGGVLYGSAYIALSKAFADKEEISEQDIETYLSAQIDAIMARGKAEPGNKTMLDPLNEAKIAVVAAKEQGKSGLELLKALKLGADKGMKDTASMEAAKGRACYRPDKGVGHLDPGAVTMEYQLRTFADAMIGTQTK